MTENVELKEGHRLCPKTDTEVPLVTCMFCPYGHMLECHHPYTCEEANCSHYQTEMESEE